MRWWYRRARPAEQLPARDPTLDASEPHVNLPPSRSATLAALVLSAMLVHGCKSDGLVVTFPTGTFVAGAPSGAQTTGQVVVVTPPSTASFEAGETYNWHVDVSVVTELTVNSVIVYVDSWEEGFYEIPIGEAERTPAGFDIPSVFEPQEGQTFCNRDYRGIGTCYTELSTGTTDLGFAAANEPDPATPTGGAGLSWGEPVLLPITVAEPDKGGKDPAENCEPVSVGGCTMTTCCTVSQCRYEVNGANFPCDGTDCTNAVQGAVAACLAAAS